MSITIKFDFDKVLENYTPAEVEFLNQMHEELTRFNASIPEEFNEEITYPTYTADEKLAYSHYRQLLIQESVRGS
ncbi:MAG: hypothetical protein RIB71_27710 [Imperialibacter sp.]|uniref:hypothetical protein n=1 Tax=Imperialibacter sp. TaxID=2038411 RepID=UPI0032EFD86A